MDNMLLIIALLLQATPAMVRTSSNATKYADKHIAYAEPLAQVVRQLDADMVRVEGGSFVMGCTAEQGSECDEDERPAHRVNVGDFWLSKYEVTQEFWVEVMGSDPSNFTDCALCPVESVRWLEVQEFIEELNKLTGKRYRLPTEAEWEYAARGGKLEKATMYSGNNDIGSVGWYKENSGGRTHVVGEKLPNELGLYDMTGNVWEWCSDRYDEAYYGRSPVDDPQGPAGGEYCVTRGGSWANSPSTSRVTVRNWFMPNEPTSGIGFRLARTE